MQKPEAKDGAPEDEQPQAEAGTQVTAMPEPDDERPTQQIDISTLKEEALDPAETTQAEISTSGLKLDEGPGGE
jgi:hypothetical protein